MSDRLNILVAEDSKSQRRILQSYLAELDANITMAEDGMEGMKHALYDELDLVISDVEMPGCSGLEICREVHEVRSHSVPVILISNLCADSDVEAGFQAGAGAYLVKPFKKEELIQSVNNILQKNKIRKQQHILLVDDSSSIRTIIRKGLEEAGFRISAAADGLQGLKMAHEDKPDLILSDLNMPQMNGIQFCRTIKRDQDLKNIPFVVMSANGDRGTMRRMMQMGATGYLVKPFSKEQVTLIIEKFLDDHVLLMMKDKEKADIEREMMLGTIMSLAQALEARDMYTNSHSKTVAAVATRIAVVMGLEGEELEAITLAGKLHDIGKIGISDQILLKPGRLTDEEFDVIRTHPTIGYEILHHIPSLSCAMPAVLHHHEKYCGGGYPDGIAGEDIPLPARIIAVADVWHAIYSDRPYRPAMPREKALSIIREESGKGLCPKCVDAFFALEERNEIPQEPQDIESVEESLSS